MTTHNHVTTDEPRMTHGQRYQAAQDWRTLQHAIVAAIFALSFAVCLIEPLLA